MKRRNPYFSAAVIGATILCATAITLSISALQSATTDAKTTVSPTSAATSIVTTTPVTTKLTGKKTNIDSSTVTVSTSTSTLATTLATTLASVSATTSSSSTTSSTTITTTVLTTTTTTKPTEPTPPPTEASDSTPTFSNSILLPWKDEPVEVAVLEATQQNVDDNDLVLHSTFFSNGSNKLLFGHRNRTLSNLEETQVDDIIVLTLDGIETAYTVTISAAGHTNDTNNDILDDIDNTTSLLYSETGGKDTLRIITCRADYEDYRRWVVVATAE